MADCGMTEMKVILIGGAPMVGKSSVARRLAARLGYGFLSTDDLAQGVRALTSPDSNPELHPMDGHDFREYYIRHSVDELIAKLHLEHRSLRKALDPIILSHATWGHPIVIEGWHLHPEWAAGITESNVTSLWLIADEDLLQSRADASVDFFQGSSDPCAMKSNYLQRSLWHNDQIKHAAERHLLPVVHVTLGMSLDELERCCLEAVTTKQKRR